MLSQLILPIAATFLCYGLFHIMQFLYRELTSPLRHMDGPRNPSLLLGNFKEMADDATLTSKWRSKFGPNFRFHGLFSISELHSSDIKAVNHIITNSSIYQKAPFTRTNTKRLFGGGILTLELDEHRRQRRIMNQAFGVAQIRLLTEVFVEKAVQLRDVWVQQVAQENGAACIEVMSWLRRMTLDVIGQAGFNYQFGALETTGKPNELNQAFTDLLHSPNSQIHNGFRLAGSIVPILRLLPLPGVQITTRARNTMYSIGGGIVSQSKAALKASEVDTALSGRRDILSVLLKSNLSTNVPEAQRLSDSEVIAQIPTFFLAGHETTSSAVTWALHALSQNPAVQSKLREELFTLTTENPTMEELNSLPYLESVVRETMRVHAPVPFVQRMAMQDDVLPLSKPYIDKYGKSHDSLPIPKGQVMHIPMLAVNTDKEIWGEDAGEFNPERWEHIPEAVGGIPSVWANLFTFFAGPHNCIGFRFSLVEIKSLLFTLIRAFEFEPAVPKGDIVPKIAGFLQRPTVQGKMSKMHEGSSLPLIVKPYNPQAY
ncbi:cytochrome P450 [Mycena maculata]|uniref:Cytochrome P450 n=1 Tax=Mycena maculata TaxID=230809 RepID=A0AAD7I7I2_9AGAR|nr:cytochrome P450 [Mycena maculata]